MRTSWQISRWAGLFALCLLAPAMPVSAADEPVWPDLRKELFDARTINDGGALLQLDAPFHPQDAGLVPIGIRILKPQSPGWHVKTLTLVADHNPVPVAAVFHLAGDAGIGHIVTRIRIDRYSDVRVVAEASDGQLYMVSRYIKATGGCSAPAMSGADGENKIGEMRLRQHRLQADAANPAGWQAGTSLVLQIRHPNHSGFQKHPLQGYFIPAHFVETIAIQRNGAPLLSVEGAISLSENPTIRFDYSGERDGEISVRAQDTDGTVFSRSWPLRQLQRDSALRHN
jgi:sulfur-oxidizing protein SoxY